MNDDISTPQLKAAIQGFLDEQFQKKADADLKKREKALVAGDVIAQAEAEQKIAELKAKYAVDNWLAKEAMRFVEQLKFGTHLSKHVHPDSKGDNVYFPPTQTLPEDLCGSQSVPLQEYALDCSGNAAALPLAGLFNIMVNEAERITLGTLLLADHPAVLHAFGNDVELSEQYCRRFQAALNNTVKNPQTHERNKQVLWPNSRQAIRDNDYTGLVLLYPSALANYVHRHVGNVRFSDSAKAARDARFKGKGETAVYADMTGLAYLKLGGTKPQNVSQLNSKQGGRHYLLPSMPPAYTSPDTHLSRNSSDFFNPMLVRACGEGRRLLEQAIQVKSNNLATRELRDSALYAIIQQILFSAEKLQQQPAGWSDGYALSSAAQIYWLDPHHPKFQDDSLIPQNWQDSVADGFARWLQSYLKYRFKKLKDEFTDTEFDYWHQIFMEIIQTAAPFDAGVLR